jgi:hydrogenase expression/formation protein HypC
MCLASPGKILSLYEDGSLLMGEVDFLGVRKKICLAYTPDAQVGDYVIVHVGFSIALLDSQKGAELLRDISRFSRT